MRPLLFSLSMFLLGSGFLSLANRIPTPDSSMSESPAEPQRESLGESAAPSEDSADKFNTQTHPTLLPETKLPARNLPTSPVIRAREFAEPPAVHAKELMEAPAACAKEIHDDAPLSVAPTIEAPPEATPESDAEVFARIFSKQESTSVVVPCLINGQDIGGVLVELNGSEGALFAAAPVLASLSAKIEKKIVKSLANAVDQNGRLSLAALQAAGFEASFDSSRVELNISTKPEQLNTSIHRVQSSGMPENAASAKKSSSLSAYLNTTAAQKLQWSSEEEPGRQPLALRLDGALQWRGWVLEGRPDYLEDRQQSWLRGDLLLVRNDPSRALRYAVGDLGTPSSGFQSSLPVLGVGVFSNFALQPYSKIYPTGRLEFFLDHPSEVTIFANGAAVQTLRLPAGRHDLRDLPMTLSTNEIKLVIREDTGLSRELSLRANTASNLLAPGKHQFAYSLGAPLIDDGGARAYDVSQPLLSASHRAGITNTLTLGGSLSAIPSRQLIGPQLVWATRFGTIGLDLTGSLDEASGTGFAISSRYDLLWAAKNKTTRRLNVSGEHRSDDFQSIGALAPVVYSDDLSLSYGQRVGKNLQLDLSVRYQLGQEDTSQTATAIMSRSFKNGLSLSLFTSGKHGGNTPDDLKGMLTARWILPEKGQAFQLLSKSGIVEPRSNQMAWSYQGKDPSGALSASASLNEADSEYEAQALVGYTGQKILATASGSTEGALTLEASSAVVFAGKRFAVSRPISGAFAIIAPNQTIRDYQIEVNPGPFGNQARTNWLGPAVLPNLQPYHVQDIRLNSPTLPVGYSLGAGSQAVLPSYKSGVLLIAGEEGTVSLRGELHFPDGAPVALASGELVPIGRKGETLYLFTNRAGRFGLEAVIPGKYQLHLLGLPPIIIEIPKNHRGGYSVGVLIVARE